MILTHLRKRKTCSSLPDLQSCLLTHQIKSSQPMGRDPQWVTKHFWAGRERVMGKNPPIRKGSNVSPHKYWVGRGVHVFLAEWVAVEKGWKPLQHTKSWGGGGRTRRRLLLNAELSIASFFFLSVTKIRRGSRQVEQDLDQAFEICPSPFQVSVVEEKKKAETLNWKTCSEPMIESKESY